ncbi:MAG: O-antigen ligase family protein, partial [Candidatus Helarchaeota archaeon]
MYAIFQFYGIDPFLKNFGYITSTIGQKNLISNYIAMFLPIQIYFITFTEKNKTIYYVFLIINYTALMICQSRGIWISLFCAFIIVAVYIFYKKQVALSIFRKRKHLITLSIIFVIITLIYSTDNFINKRSISVPSRAISVFNQEDPSINTRLLIWRTTLEMIKEKPLIGHGLGAFQINYPLFQAQLLKENPHLLKYITNPMDAHNEYLQLVAEIGIIGFMIIFIIFFYIFKKIVSFLNRENISVENKTFIITLTSSLLIFLIHSMFTFPLQNPATGSAFIILLSITTAHIDIKKKTDINYHLNFLINNALFKKIFLLLFVILIIFFNYSFVIKPYISELYYYKGMQKYSKQDYLGSIPLLEISILYNNSNGRAHHALGAVYYNIGDTKKAYLHMKKAENNFIDKRLLRNLGLYYSYLNNYDKAEKYFTEAIYFDPTYFQAYNSLASLYIHNYEHQKAIEQWERAINLGFDFEEKYIFLYYIGMAYQRMDKQE